MKKEEINEKIIGILEDYKTGWISRTSAEIRMNNVLELNAKQEKVKMLEEIRDKNICVTYYAFQQMLQDEINKLKQS